ncbi:hypothetical protein [Aquimarina aquimarini]|uniref:hypothetical protein n=1 Tax=Aquimarina aquimarini TaxID=1191734 RepID=UPI000D55B720|nr:hypothetical protein [Aquimarina aquimarini]
MLTKILKLKDIQEIDKNQQSSIKGGTFPFPSTDHCGCIVMGNGGYLEIIAISCDSICPDGSNPVPGLGH